MLVCGWQKKTYNNQLEVWWWQHEWSQLPCDVIAAGSRQWAVQSGSGRKKEKR